jgi:hypothetical protein
MDPFKNKHWIGIRRKPEREEDRSKPGRGPFWRKQENAAKHGARLKRWRATESYADASQMPFVTNGTKRYTNVTTTKVEGQSDTEFTYGITLQLNNTQ